MCDAVYPTATMFTLLVLALLSADASAGGAAVDVAAYDRDLCVLAQRMLVNADGPGEPPFGVQVLSGTGNGFHTIQMDVDASTRTVVVAQTTGTVRADGRELATHVACKLVDRDRVNDVLDLDLAGPVRSCRDVNEHTYQLALASLATDERQRYQTAGRTLRFGEDYYASAGAEWLPVAVDQFITASPGDGRDAGYLEIRAPAVVVPWNRVSREFFQGTHHCKLVTLAAMQRWMRGGALSGDAVLFPPARGACVAPSAETSTVGSCLFYFAPANARFCQDYSGANWTVGKARADCGKRHASPEALRAAGSRYEGAGGVFSGSSCEQREDHAPHAGTCVFHCRQPDETLWHTLQGEPGSEGGGAAGSMMSRACDLFLAK